MDRRFLALRFTSRKVSSKRKGGYLTSSLDCEIYDMIWVKPHRMLLVYCHSTCKDKNLKKSKIISFNFNKPNPSPTVYFSDYQAPPNRGKIMKLNKDQNWLFLAECENAGSFSNCNLRVLGDLTPT